MNIACWHRLSAPTVGRQKGKPVSLDKQIRKRCSRAIASLEFTRPVTVADVCDRVTEVRGRPIRVLTHELPPGCPCGLRLATASADYLVVPVGAGRAYQDLIALHEVGHVLLDPDDVQSRIDYELLAAILPHVDPATVSCMLGRSLYTEDAEKAAEIFATLLWTRIISPLGKPQTAAVTSADDTVGRIGRALESGRQ